MRLSALQRANAVKNSGKARKAAVARRDESLRELDWDVLIARLRVLLDGAETRSGGAGVTDVPGGPGNPPQATTAPGKGHQ